MKPNDTKANIFLTLTFILKIAVLDFVAIGGIFIPLEQKQYALILKKLFWVYTGFTMAICLFVCGKVISS